MPECQGDNFPPNPEMKWILLREILDCQPVIQISFIGVIFINFVLYLEYTIKVYVYLFPRIALVKQVVKLLMIKSYHKNLLWLPNPIFVIRAKRSHCIPSILPGITNLTNATTQKTNTSEDSSKKTKIKGYLKKFQKQQTDYNAAVLPPQLPFHSMPRFQMQDAIFTARILPSFTAKPYVENPSLVPRVLALITPTTPPNFPNTFPILFPRPLRPDSASPAPTPPTPRPLPRDAHPRSLALARHPSLHSLLPQHPTDFHEPPYPHSDSTIPSPAPPTPHPPHHQASAPSHQAAPSHRP